VEALTAEPRPAEQAVQAAAAAAPAAAPEGPQPDAGAPAVGSCSHCGAPLAAGQDWCLRCGAGVSGSLGTPGWRPAAVALGAVAALALGAAAAGYAALNTHAPRARVLVTTVARAATPAPVTPPAATTPPATPTTKATLPPTVIVKAPKIPLAVTTPKSIVTTPPVATKPVTTPTSSPSSGSSGGSGSGEEATPSALTLDTNAASTYNPYKLPSVFGDPSLAIDGDSSTGWTAEVEPTTAPKMAAGLLIDLKAPQRLSALQLITTTPGMTVQVYGANSTTVPSSITDPAWVALSHSTVVHKRHVHLTLRESKHAFRWVTLWISQAPASSVGTAQAPGRVTVNEVELFPA